MSIFLLENKNKWGNLSGSFFALKNLLLLILIGAP